MNLQRTIEVARAAARMGGPGPLSTGEALTAALVLNRHDWLDEMDYTIAEALDRSTPTQCSICGMPNAHCAGRYRDATSGRP